MTDIYLYPGESLPADVRLTDPTILWGGGGFPTQYAGLRAFYGGSVQELCLVALGDAPSGNVMKIKKGGTVYAIYLVDTSDSNASPIRIRTTTTTKAIRKKT